MEYEGYSNNGAAEVAPRRETRELASRRAYTPAEIDGELYEMAKRRVAERGQVILHVAAFCAGTFAMLVASETILYGMAPLFGIIFLLWGIAVFLHVVTYFVKASPEKVLKEYDRIARRM